MSDLLARVRGYLAADPALAAALATLVATLVAWLASESATAAAITALVTSTLGFGATRALVTPHPLMAALEAAAWADGAVHALPVRPPRPGDAVVVDGTRRLVSATPGPLLPPPL